MNEPLSFILPVSQEWIIGIGWSITGLEALWSSREIGVDYNTAPFFPISSTVTFELAHGK